MSAVEIMQYQGTLNEDKYIHLGGGENCRLLKGYLLLKGRLTLRFADQEAGKAFQVKGSTMNKAET